MVVTNRDRRRFSRAETVAFLGRHHRVRVGAVLFRGSRFLASAACVPGPDPHEPFYPGHAEARVLDSAKPKSTLYVARINLNNELMPSRPCPTCLLSLVLDGNVSTLVYFDGEQIRKTKIRRSY